MNRDINVYVDSEMHHLISDLQRLIKQPSISAKGLGLAECAAVVMNILLKAGINSELLYLYHDSNRNSIKDGKYQKMVGRERHRDQGSRSSRRTTTRTIRNDVPPLVYGEVRSKSNPNGKTILFYNHYDVQPAEPIELWDKADPFSGKVKGNYIFGRGASDDKGELITRIKAVEYYLKEIGDVPCNVKFIVEGEEQIRSVHLEEYLSRHRKKFSCDGIILGFVSIDEDKTRMDLGLKDILSVELISKGPSRDAHSSLAVLIENPAWRLIRALGSISNRDGRSLIKNWYHETQEFTKEDDPVKNESTDKEQLKREDTITPTINIREMKSGYTGEGAKTVLPSKAVAILDFHLTRNMHPQKQFKRLKNHLVEKGFADTIELKLMNREDASWTHITNSFVKLVEKSAREIFGTIDTSVPSVSYKPMYYLSKIIGVPCACIRISDKHANAHSPNEYARLDLLKKKTKCITNIIFNLATG